MIIIRPVTLTCDLFFRPALLEQMYNMGLGWNFSVCSIKTFWFELHSRLLSFQSIKTNSMNSCKSYISVKYMTTVSSFLV